MNISKEKYMYILLYIPTTNHSVQTTLSSSEGENHANICKYLLRSHFVLFSITSSGQSGLTKEYMSVKF